MTKSRWLLLVGLLAGPLPGVRGASPEPPRRRLTYQQHVRPIPKAHCFQCHGAQLNSKGSDLNGTRNPQNHWAVVTCEHNAALVYN